MEEPALLFAQIYQHKLQNTIHKFNSNLPEHLSSCPLDIDVAELQNIKYLLKPKTLPLRIIADCKKQTDKNSQQQKLRFLCLLIFFFRWLSEME